MSRGIWVSTEVSFKEVGGLLWGEGKKLWAKMSDDEQWDCFDWMREELSIEDETGDIDLAIVRWYEEERDASAYERRCGKTETRGSLRPRNKGICRRH